MLVDYLMHKNKQKFVSNQLEMTERMNRMKKSISEKCDESIIPPNNRFYLYDLVFFFLLALKHSSDAHLHRECKQQKNERKL